MQRSPRSNAVWGAVCPEPLLSTSIGMGCVTQHEAVVENKVIAPALLAAGRSSVLPLRAPPGRCSHQADSILCCCCMQLFYFDFSLQKCETSSGEFVQKHLRLAGCSAPQEHMSQNEASEREGCVSCWLWLMEPRQS